MTRPQRETAGHPALPFSARGVFIALAVMLLLSGCGSKPKPPTAPIRTHLQDAIASLPQIPATTPWQRFTFNDWERLRARAGLGDTPVAEWSADAHSKASDTLQGWLLSPSTVIAASALASLGMNAATLRWQAALDGPADRPIARLVTAPTRDDRPKQIGAALAPLGYNPLPPATQASAPAAYTRAASPTAMLPALLDGDAAALIATSSAFVTVHDASRVPDAVAAGSSNGANLDSAPFFHGLVTGISDVEALVIYRIGMDGYRDATAPPLDTTLPFDALGAALHITDAGAQYVTLALHVAALPGGRLPEGMAEWWATRFGLDQPDFRVEYLEAFGNDGWLFARYRILPPDERIGGVPLGETPFWKYVTTWQPVRQRWVNFTPRNADPIPRIGS